MNHRFAIALTLLLTLLTSCASHAPARSTESEADYVLVYLKTGPRAAEKTKAENDVIFAGHMQNMTRLANERKLVMAGPFSKPRDPSWRGIFVFDVASLDEADRLTATDPGIEAGVFVAERFPLRATSALRRTIEFDRAERTAMNSQSTTPAATVRAFVMITAEDAERAERALTPLTGLGRVVWSGRFGGERAGAGVFVLDADTVDVANAMIGDAREELGECAIDSWWSTRALVRLPAAIAELRGAP